MPKYHVRRYINIHGIGPATYIVYSVDEKGQQIIEREVMYEVIAQNIAKVMNKREEEARALEAAEALEAAYARADAFDALRADAQGEEQWWDARTLRSWSPN